MPVAALAVGAGLLLSLPGVAAEENSPDLVQAIKGGQFHLAFRYRYELVDQDNIGKDANASTLRTRLTYRTADYRNFSALLELDDVHTIIGNEYNDTRNGKNRFPVVADPKGAGLNQGALIYRGFRNTEITVGRQRIIRGNHRFIGNVGWRQNEQTYDAASASFKPNDRLKVFYSYINQVKRIFGPESGTPVDTFDSNSHILDASYVFSPQATLTAYGYWLDFDNAPAASNATFGARLTGKYAVNTDVKLLYTAELATQSDIKNNPNNYHANYYFLEAGVNWSGFGLKAGYEVLEGGSVAGHAFQTPLATLHAMNGWADQFLATPTGGLEDFSITASARMLNGNMTLVYHDFSAETGGGGSYGSELDFVSKWAIAKRYSALAKFALYNTDGFKVDTNKFWLMLSAKF